MLAMSFSSCLRKASSSKSGGAMPVAGSDCVVVAVAAGAGAGGLGFEKSSRTSAGGAECQLLQDVKDYIVCGV